VGEAALIWTSQDSIAALIRELARAFKVGVLSSAYGLAKSAQGKAIKQTPHYGYTIISRLRELGVSHVLADYPHSTELLTIAELYRRINGELED